jgi:UDP-glucose:glycoprotein glucosyltransferase
MLGNINDTDTPDMSHYFYDLPTTLKRRNKYIYPSTGGGDGRLRVLTLPEVYADTGLSEQLQDWIYPGS